MLRVFSGRDGGSVPVKLQQLIIAVATTCFIWWFANPWRGIDKNTSALPANKTPHLSSNDEEPFYKLPTTGRILRHNNIVNMTRPDIQMARICLSVRQSDLSALPLLQGLDIDVPSSSQFHLGDESSEAILLQSTVSTSIQIPHLHHSRPDASEFIFGVATTYERLESALDTMAHWLSSSNTRLIAAMEPAPDNDLPGRVLRKAQSLKIPLTTIESGYPYLDRYFSLIRVLHTNRLPTTKWYVIVDDDTFFPDFNALVSTFKTKYDPTKSYYIGALTEDFQQMSTWGYMAYGGGGVFLSHPLVEQLLPHWDTCYKKRNTGDRMLAECIYKHTTTKFTWEHNLHQLDLHGDQSGFYEALRPQPLSVHHWHSEDFGFYADMYNLSLVSSICGNSCLLQKFKLGNEWILTNGFSLVKYSSYDLGHRDIDTDISMERTWNFFYAGANEAQFEHSLGPIRKPDEKGKISFRMESALRDGDGSVRQLYIKRRRRLELGDGPGSGEVEGAVEVVWTMA